MTDPATSGPLGAPWLAVDVQPDNLEGTFTLDVSELDGPAVLGWSETDAGQWVNVVCDVSRLFLRRGATRLLGVLTRAEAAECTVAVTDWSGMLDPLLNGDAVHKGTPIRLRAWGTFPGVEWAETRRNLAPSPHAGIPTSGLYADQESSWYALPGTGVLATDKLPRTTGAPDGGPYVRFTWPAATTNTAGTGSGAAVRVDGRAASPLPIPVTPGTVYTGSVYTRTSVAQRMAGTLWWYTAAGAQISTSTGTGVVVNRGVWGRLAVTGTAPATAAYCAVGVSEVSGTGAVPRPSGSTWDGTMALLEQAGTVGTYFDGSTTDTENQVYGWTGTPHASPSTRTTGTPVDALPWEAILFTGEVDELHAEYLPDLPATVTITTSDLIAPLAAWEAEGRTGDGVGAGDDLLERVQRVLDETDRGSINTAASDTGYAATLNPTVLDRGWDTIVAAADAELGRVWVDENNQLVIRARNSQLSGPVRGTLSDVHGEAVESPHTCMAAAAVVHGVELLANRAVASRRLLEGQDPDTALVVRREDTYSQARYGVGAVDRKGQLELATDGQLEPWAEAVVVAGNRPELRVDSVTPSPTGDDLAEAMEQWPAVMATTIGDRWRFRFHPLAGHVVDRMVGVLGVEMELTPDAWTITWTTTEAAGGEWFRLGVSELDGADVLAPYAVPVPAS